MQGKQRMEERCRCQKEHWGIHFLPQQACAKISGAKQPKTIVSNEKGELEESCA